MIGYPIVFRCCECTVEEQTMDHLESHIWSRHLHAFPFRCSFCDFPALSAASLIEHFAHNHGEEPKVEFKRNLEDEKRFRKMVSESIALEYDNTQPDATAQLTSLQPMMHQGTAQLMLLPPQNNRYGNIVAHRVSDNDFGVLEDDENVEELIEEDDEYIEELGNPVFIGADGDSNFLIEDDLSQTGPMRATNNYHLKYIRTRRMDKLIDNVVVNSAQRASPDSTSNQPDCNFSNSHEETMKTRRYNCDQCSRTFKFQSKLQEHLRTHLGVRPFPCPYCSREFSQKGALKTHMRLHTGERPFYCQWDCGKQFASSSARRHHEKTHSGERPYVCSACGKGFTKNSHVVRHLKNIHNREYIQDDVLLHGDLRSNEESGSIVIDMEPRGKEIQVVQDIVEQIHEEKFCERKGFMPCS
uniref:Zinc finger protein n=1 Tax=Caenorhabditis tropicalis TaxID=1561998 RepID=A0A1I7TKU2_9PELO